MRFRTTFLTLLFSVVITAQSIDDLKRDTKSLYEATYNMAFDNVLDYTYPLVFKFMERADMYATMDMAFQNDNYRIRFVYTTPYFSFSEIKTLNNGLYCVVSYENAIRMTYEKPINGEVSQQKIKESIQKNFPDAIVTFEKERNAFYIIKNEKLIAIADEFTDGKWKFISFDPKYKELLDAVITEKVRKQLGL